MMTVNPRLEMMRARRQIEEDELTAPHRAVAAHAMQVAKEERAAREGLERIMRSKLMPHLVEQVGREMGRGLHLEIMKALHSSIGEAATGTTTITVPTVMLMGCDHDSVVSRVVQMWKSENAPRMGLRAVKGMEEIRSGFTLLDIKVPAMRVRHAVADSAL